MNDRARATRPDGSGQLTALVTGAAGFVGRWLVDALRRDGIAVTAMTQAPVAATHTEVGLNALMAPLHWCVGDLRDDAFVASSVQMAAPDFVVHLAAISHVPTADADPAAAWDVNVTATARLLRHVERARDRGACSPAVLIVGSAEQYGRRESFEPIDESQVQLPRTVYAATKAAQEILALQVWRASGLRTVIARSFNHSGRGQEPRFLLPALVARAVALRGAPAQSPLAVGNTTPVRDFLHVSDVVSAYISLLHHGVSGEVYNVASGVGRSVQQIVERVVERVGIDAPIVVDPALVRPVDVPALVGDARKLQLQTGWRALRTFDDIIDDLIQHAETH